MEDWVLEAEHCCVRRLRSSWAAEQAVERLVVEPAEELDLLGHPGWALLQAVGHQAGSLEGEYQR